MRILSFMNEPYGSFEQDTSNIVVRLPLLGCGVPFEHRDHVFQNDLRAHGPAEAARRARAVVDAFRPDVVVRHQTPAHIDLPRDFWRGLRADGIRVIVCIYDTTVFHFDGEAAAFEDSDVFAVFDSLSTYLEFRLLRRVLGRGPTVVFASGQFHHESFDPTPEPKDCDVLFVGSREGGRAVFLDRLGELLRGDGISLVLRGGLTLGDGRPVDRAEWLDWPAFQRAIRRARICLNMQSYRSRSQIKGRLYESMACGTFCLTDDNPDSRRYIPNDLVGWFGSVEDCANQVRHWLAHEAEREAAARAAHAWLRTTFDYRRFWADLLRHVLDPASPAPTLPVLEAEFERLVALQPVLIRQQLALITELSRLLASGQPVERMAVKREGVRGSHSVIETVDGLAAALSRPCWDLVRVGERRLAYVADMDPLPLDEVGTVSATRGRAVVGHRDGRALVRVVAELERRRQAGDATAD